ncbi:hypothetical protein BJY04DRAFT_215444 [Aspergillus karnatakaensis]|uniref:SDR family oxidoreductase n=1 Tax=Aspergillus karnatakaensis TaxID=1810916 RepID=UPI003CCCFA84
MAFLNVPEILHGAHSLFPALPPPLQAILSHPAFQTTLALVATIQALKSLNKYLTRQVQNHWTPPRPWDASQELILVTGGSSGIGHQIILDLSALGVRVIIFDIQDPPSPLPPNAHFYKTDLTLPSSIASSAALLRQEHGDPTVLINNAGVGTKAPILSTPENQIRAVFNVNVLAHFWTVKEFLPAMLESDHGHVVTVASMASFTTSAELVPYCCSKAAALAFHEGVGQEVRYCYGEKKGGVRTSIIHPLWVQTPMIKAMVQKGSLFKQPVLTVEEVSRAVVQQIVRGNGGQLCLPGSYGMGAMVRGLPGWIQEWVRDYYSNIYVRLGRMEEEVRLGEGN